MKPDRNPSKKPVALESRDVSSDGRRYSPSIARNRDVVRDVFLAHMPVEGRLLEIASGTGEHGVHITARCPDLHWMYSDIDADSIDSQAAWVAQDQTGCLHGPMHLNVTNPWINAEGPWDALFCANMIHIAPFAAAEGLFDGAGKYLKSSGKLFLYGPFSRNEEIASSNASFDADLKRRDPNWGVRDLDRQIVPLAIAAGMDLEQVVEMPANNLSVIFRKR